MTAASPLLEVRDLTVDYRRSRRQPSLRAVDRVGFTIDAGETVGLVGESGSGKSTIGRAILGLVPATSGRILLNGADISAADHRRRRILSKDLQVVFQDPYRSLNPVRTIRQTLAETLHVHGIRERRDVDARIAAILASVGLTAGAAHRYPSQFSGGQRQRIAIARALIMRPRLVVCDEAVSALDLSVQAQVLNLLRDLQDDYGLSYLFISHDLAVVRHLCRRVVVLYEGRVVEQGPTETVCDRPEHPYTRALLDAAPHPDPDEQRARRRARTQSGSTVERGSDACSSAERPGAPADRSSTAGPLLTHPMRD